MSSTGLIEVEVDYDPQSPVAARSPGAGFGILLELAMQAATAAGNGCELRDMRFGAPFRFDSTQRLRATVEGRSRDLLIASSSAEPSSQSTAHVTGTVVSSPAHAAADSMPTGPVRERLTPAALRERLSGLGKLPDLERVKSILAYDDGVSAEWRDPESGPYHFSPALSELAWLLMQVWMQRQGLSHGVMPIAVSRVWCGAPGAPVTHLHLRQSASGSAGDVAELDLTVATSHEVVAVISGLRLAGVSRAGAAGRDPIASDLAAKLRGLSTEQRHAECERHVSMLLRHGLGSERVSFPNDVAFADLGVTSALAVDLARALGEAIGHELPASLLFDHSTIARLARFLADQPGIVPRRAATASRAATAPRADTSPPVAIVGLGCRLPGGIDSPDDYWELLKAGRSTVAAISSERIGLVPSFAEIAFPMSLLERVDEFDARFFGISDREAASMDPQQRILLEVTWEALERAGIVASSLMLSATGVFMGGSIGEYAALTTQADAYELIGNAPSVVAGRLSYFFGLRGPSMCVETACSSSLAAVCAACDSLRSRDVDLAIAGGVNLLLNPSSTRSIAAAGILSAKGRCAAFDDDADGYVRGEGCGVVILRRLEDALARKEPVLAVIRGYAVGHGGRGNGLAAPNREAQAQLARLALARAGIDARDVGYIEAHGTGTVGDVIELNALKDNYGTGSGRTDPTLVGTAKTNLGHLEIASGIAGLLKTVLALVHAEVPRNLHFQTPVRAIDWHNLGLTICDAHRGWPGDPRRRVAGVNSFGIGGTNVHLLLSGFDGLDSQSRVSHGPYIVPVSGASQFSVRRLANAYAEDLDRGRDPADLALTSGQHRDHLKVRAAVVASNRDGLCCGLREFAAGTAPIAQPCTGEAKVAFIYAGQGTQHLGMGRQLFDEERVFREAIEECDELAHPTLGSSLVDALYADLAPSCGFAGSQMAQLSLFAIEYALTRLWMSWGVQPTALLGHSLGEYAAAQTAGVFNLADAIALVSRRGALFEALPETGVMAAVHASLAEVSELARPYAAELSIAAINGPRQIIVAGRERVVFEFCAAAETRGVRSQRLATSQAFHSALTDPMLDDFEQAASQIGLGHPKLRLISNVTGGFVDREMSQPHYWRDHVRKTVQFASGIAALEADGVELFLEIGPHPALAGTGAAVRSKSRWLGSLRRGDGNEREQMLRSAADLYQAGLDLDWKNLPGCRDGRLAAIPTYAFDRRSHWSATRKADVAPAAPDNGRCYTLEWVVKPAQPAPTRKRRWLIRDPGCEFAEAIRSALTSLGAETSVVDSLDSGELAGAHGFIYVLDHSDLECAEAEDLLEGVAREFVAIVDGCRALATSARPAKLWLVTRGAQPLQHTRIDLIHAALWALGRTIAIERPELWGGVVDLSQRLADQDIQVLCRSLLSDDGEDQIAIRGGRRLVARLNRALPQRAEFVPGIRPDATYLVTGGLGYVGLHVARFLVRRGARHLILLGRRGLETADDNGLTAARHPASRSLDELRASGASLRVEAADVCDIEALKSVLARADRPVMGIFHAAGVNYVSPIATLQEGSLRRALRPKITGAWALHRLARELELPLDHFVMFSSMSSLLPGLGQAGYAVGNAFADALSRHRRALGLPALSVSWGPWAGGGMASHEGHEESMAGVGMRALPPNAAIAELERLMDSATAHCAVADIDWRRFSELYAVRRDRPMLHYLAEAPAPRGQDFGDVKAFITTLSEMSEEERADRLIERLTLELRSILLNGDAQARPEQSFVELGLDSLAAVELRRRCELLLGQQLSVSVIFDFPSIESLARELLARHSL